MLFTMQFLFPEPIKKSGFEGNVMFAVTHSNLYQFNGTGPIKNNFQRYWQPQGMSGLRDDSAT